MDGFNLYYRTLKDTPPRPGNTTRPDRLGLPFPTPGERSSGDSTDADSNPRSSTNVHGRQNHLRDVARRPVSPGTAHHTEVRASSDGPKRTVLSLSQKPDTPRVVDFWMSALAGITLFSAVFPTLSLHRTLESVCPPSVNPVKGLCETGSTANFSLGSLSIGNRSGLPPSPPTLSMAAESWAIGAERKPRAMGR